MSNWTLAAAVALLASTAGCFASVEEHDEAATASVPEALVASQPATFDVTALSDPGTPMPLDHPTLVPSIRLRPGAPGFRFEPEPDEWERNPRAFRCALRYVTIWEPRGTPLEVPVAACP